MWWRRHGILWSCQTLAHNHHFSSSNCQIFTQLFLGPLGTVSRSLTKKTIVQKAERGAKTHNETIPVPRCAAESQIETDITLSSRWPTAFTPGFSGQLHQPKRITSATCNSLQQAARVLINREVKAGKISTDKDGRCWCWCVETAHVEVKRQDQVLWPQGQRVSTRDAGAFSSANLLSK